MTPVTRNCDYCDAPFEPKRDHQRFCCVKCRVYAGRYGANFGKPKTASDNGHATGGSTGPPASDQSIGAALAAVRDNCPVRIAETKTVGAIRVERTGSDPNHWTAHIPAASSGAATRIHGDLINQIGDLISLANKIGGEIGEPLYSLRTKPRPKH